MAPALRGKTPTRPPAWGGGCVRVYRSARACLSVRAWCVVCGVWCVGVVCGVWCVVCGVCVRGVCGCPGCVSRVCGVWCVVCGVWCVWVSWVCVLGVWCVVCVWCVCGVCVVLCVVIAPIAAGSFPGLGLAMGTPMASVSGQLRRRLFGFRARVGERLRVSRVLVGVAVPA